MFFFSFLIILFYNSIYINCDEKIITCPTRLIGGVVYLEISVGDNRKIIPLQVSLANNYTYITDTHYKDHKSQYLQVINQNKTMIINQREAKGDIVIDLIRLNTETPIETNFTFYSTYDGQLLSIDSFGFGLSFVDTNYSLINRLYDIKLIELKVFGFLFENSFYGKMFFGGIPKNELIDYTHHISCHSSFKYNNWNCKMNKISIQNKHYLFTGDDGYFYFDTSQFGITAPSKFIDYLKKEIFGKYFEHKICTQLNSLVGSKTIKIDCLAAGIHDFPDFKFLIENTIFRLTKQDLFECSNDKCVFQINQSIVGKDKWVFGTSFLRKYISSFNYQDGIIKFYSKTPFETALKDNSYKIKSFFLMITNLSMTSIMSFILYFIILYDKTVLNNLINSFN